MWWVGLPARLLWTQYLLQNNWQFIRHSNNYITLNNSSMCARQIRLHSCIAFLNEMVCDGSQLSEIDYLTDVLTCLSLYLIAHPACFGTSMPFTVTYSSYIPFALCLNPNTRVTATDKMKMYKSHQYMQVCRLQFKTKISSVIYYTPKNALLYYSFIHSVFCLTTGPKPTPKWCHHIMRSRASSFKLEYPLLSLRSSSSFLHLLPRLLATSISPFIFPSITCFRRQFLRKMWSIRLATIYSYIF